ncbi:MAG: phosphonate ABC transporter ATP-binding protein, partial [Myxococcota bacterium]|nr:phosphonate ABC transporter ATP-binding protein [Myxococcota bacterium]
MVQCINATKRFPDGTVALRGVTLDVPAGQFCVVLGSSGAGKSTLLRAINGLVTLTSGSVEVDGTKLEPRTLAPVRAKVGMVHQSFGLVGRTSVLDNVLAGALSRVSTVRAMLSSFPERYRRKACELLDDVGLDENHLYRRTAELSGGQQQRVAIARAFLLDPVVVLADEPVASLDVSMSETILRLLRETSARRGTTVICSLHQVNLARHFADRIVAMRFGEVIADGPPSELDDTALAKIYARESGAFGAIRLAHVVPQPAGETVTPRHAVAAPTDAEEPRLRRPAAQWELRHPLGRKTIALAMLAAALLAVSARRTEIPRLFALTAEWVGAGLGLHAQSQIGKGLGRFAADAFPLVIAQVTPVGRIEGLDRNHLPLFARVEKRETKTSRYDFAEKKMVEASATEEVLVEPAGYLL